MISGINRWQQFHKKVRLKQPELFLNLENFPNAVFIAGCQRSGTTILSRIIRSSEGFNNDFPAAIDDELHAALILSGREPGTNNGRYCLQTTYLNENYREYGNLRPDQKLIWVVREPQSVVFSMIYRWKTFALDELFVGCGLDEIHAAEQKYKLLKYGYHFFPKLLKACYAYNGKSKQIFEIKKLLGNRVLIIEYEQMIKNKKEVLEEVFSFISGKYVDETGDKLVNKSLNKKKKLSDKEKRVINEMCLNTYTDIQSLLV